MTNQPVSSIQVLVSSPQKGVFFVTSHNHHITLYDKVGLENEVFDARTIRHKMFLGSKMWI